jgi:tetratricopeptide (TPR) repeat protein
VMLGTASRSLGRPDEAIASWHRALDAFEAAGQPDAAARLCLDAGLQVAWWIRGGRPSELVERGLRAIGDRITPERAGLIALAGAIATQAGSYEDGARLSDEALPMARRFDDPRILGLVLYARSAHHFAFNEFEETIAYGKESLAFLRESGELWNLANVLGYMGASAMWLGRFDEANEYGTVGLVLARRLQNWSAVIFCERAQLLSWWGDRPDFEWYAADGKRALELGDAQGFRWLSALGRTRIGLACFWSGRWDDAIAHFEEAARLDPPGASGGHTGGLILTHAYAGDHGTARSLLERSRPEVAEPGTHSLRDETLALVAIEAFALLGDDEQAAVFYPMAVDRLSKGIIGRGWDTRLMWTIAGIGATAAGKWDEAEEHFEEGLRRIDALPLRIEEGDCLRFYAWMLLRRGRGGDAERARVLLSRAVDAYRRLGMPAHQRLAERMLQTA